MRRLSMISIDKIMSGIQSEKMNRGLFKSKEEKEAAERRSDL